MRRWPQVVLAGSLAVVVAVIPAAAQELQAFHYDDIVDPQLLIARDDEGEEHSVSFFASRFFLGFVDDYQRRDQVTGTGFTIGRATGSFYRGRNQFNLEATQYNRLGLDDDHIGELRFEFGRYFFTEEPETGERIPARMLLSWRTTSGEEPGFEDELSLVVDFSGLPGTDARLYGGYVLTHVPEVGDSFLSYVLRSNVRQWDNEIAVDTGLGLGVERVDGSVRWGHTRLEVSLLLPIEIFNSYLHLLVAPYYHPHPPEGQSSFDTELAIFIDSSVFSRLFSRRP